MQSALIQNIPFDALSKTGHLQPSLTACSVPGFGISCIVCSSYIGLGKQTGVIDFFFSDVESKSNS